VRAGQRPRRGRLQPSRLLNTIWEHGDLAAGAFDDLDGELVVADGRTFQPTTSGRVNEAVEETTAPCPGPRPVALTALGRWADDGYHMNVRSYVQIRGT
jgi:hypothetical protein